MSGGGPPLWVSGGMLLLAFLAASAVAFAGAHLLHRALAGRGEARVRGAFLGTGAVLVGAAVFLLTFSQGSAYAEEAAFWVGVPGVALVARGLWRSRAST